MNEFLTSRLSNFNVMIKCLILETSFGIITASKLHNSAPLHVHK